MSGCLATCIADAGTRIVAFPSQRSSEGSRHHSRRETSAEAAEGGRATSPRRPSAATPGGGDGEPPGSRPAEPQHPDACGCSRGGPARPGLSPNGSGGRGAARAGAWRPRAVVERARPGRGARGGGARRPLRPVAPSLGRADPVQLGAAAAGQARGDGSRLRWGPARPSAADVLPSTGRPGPVIMSLRQRLAQLAGWLQEPQKVARFQRLCGVEALPRRSAAPATDPRGDEKAEAPLAGDARRREQQPGASAGPQPPGSDRNQCPAKPGGGGAPNGVRNGLATELGPASPRRVGALRRNSLTGEEGELAHVSNWPLYYLFCFGTELGNELFYILFFPFWIWNLDPLVGRKLVVIWVLVMYLGQCTKDIIRWPRPASPPVVKLEIFYNSEYSMPSTHAMSGTAIPISMVLLTYGRWQVSFPLLPCCAWGSSPAENPEFSSLRSVILTWPFPLPNLSFHGFSQPPRTGPS